MRIGIQTWGSEGDVRPFLALGLGLQRAGHEVEVVVTDVDPKDYHALGRRLGLRVTPVATPIIADPEESDRVGMQILHARNPLEQARLITTKLFDPLVPELFEASRRLARQCDLVIGHYFLFPLRAAAELAGIPEVSVNLTHGTIPTRHRSPMGFPDWGPLFNPLFWRLGRLVLDRLFLPPVNRFRVELGLAPLHDLAGEAWSSKRLNLVAVSTELCAPLADWEERHRVCGFFSLPPDAVLPVSPELESFLRTGERPVYLGFGSMTARSVANLRETATVLAEAVRQAGCRAIIQIDRERLGAAPADDRVLWVPAAPHAAVFPRCAAVVHHGGAGTTQAVLTAGVPSVVVPHISDQFFWGEELHRRGLAPKPLPFRHVTPSRLAARIREALSSQVMGEKARMAGARAVAEDGVGAAVALIERSFNSTEPSATF